jgi:hypothetical protein
MIGFKDDCGQTKEVLLQAPGRCPRFPGGAPAHRFVQARAPRYRLAAALQRAIRDVASRPVVSLSGWRFS